MKPLKLGEFRGINNLLPLERRRELGDREAGSFVHDATNVDLTMAGTFRRRPGRVRVGEHVGCRGLFEHKGSAYFAAQESLLRINNDHTITTLGTVTSAHAPVAFAEVPSGVVVSDTFSLRVIALDGAVSGLTPDAPNPLPIATLAAGALAAGQYALMYFTETADGLRSAGTYPQIVNVSEGGAVSIFAPARAGTIAVFMTTADGEIFYRVGELAPSQTSLTVSSNLGNGEGMRYRPLAPLYPGEQLTYHRGRLYSVVGRVIHFSEPYQIGLTAPDTNYLLFDEPVALMAPIDAGIFIATASKTYFMAGKEPKGSELNHIAHFGAVPGTLVPGRNSGEWMWHSPRGPVATNGSGVELLQDGNIAYEDAGHGASMVREQNGMRSLVTSLAGTIPAGAAVAGSYMDAEVITGAST